jgi:DNA-binding transcriptional MerR regulator
MEEPRWNLDELAERVDAALAVDYRGQPSGRVRAVPDRRAIRWYTTIGLIDRPVGYRGRTALYGPRHLLQLVAVKRLQARGLPLVTIQQELAGATDTQLARVAHLPADTAPTPAPAVAAGDGAPRVARAATRRGGFWRQQPAAALAHPAASVDLGRSDTGAGGIATLRGIRLGEGATLLLEPGRELDAADVRVILDAAGPLLSALRERGLAGGTATPARTGGNEPRREQP